jgi:hypothetical protein
MIPPLWAYELAAAFWRDTRGGETFPRRLREAIALSSLDLTVKELPGLTLHRAENWLAIQGSSWRCNEPDRPLHACLAAHLGGGFILVDEEDDESERLYSLAHELAHFLRHYWQPRRQAVRAVGADILDVLDGCRKPTAAERLHMLLRGGLARPYIHLMGRGAVMLPEVEGAEGEADQLAWELLAPAAEVRGRLAEEDGFDEALAVVEEVFGLPPSPAEHYADALFPEEEESPVVLDLKKVLNARRDEAR